MTIEFIITLFGLVFFAAFWKFTDPREKRMFEDLKNSRIRVMTFFEIMSAIFAYIIYFVFPQYSLNLSSNIVNIGLLIFVGGISFAVWAKVVMGKNWNHPVEHIIERQTEIVKSGPFKYSRNPIYVGLFICFVGFFISLSSPLIIFALLLALIIKKIVAKEEINLEKLFGEKYMEYKKQVPRYLLF